VFNDAIEAKVTAEQQALAAKNKLEQIKFEAEQRIVEARGKAEAMTVESNALRSNPMILETPCRLKNGTGYLPQVTGGRNYHSFRFRLSITQQRRGAARPIERSHSFKLTTISASSILDRRYTDESIPAVIDHLFRSSQNTKEFKTCLQPSHPRPSTLLVKAGREPFKVKDLSSAELAARKCSWRTGNARPDGHPRRYAAKKRPGRMQIMGSLT
jgi:hypothetical protein